MAAKTKRNALLDLIRISMLVCRRHLAKYSHPKSPRRYTQSQLMSCLILKARLDLTYRGIVELLEVSSELREAMGLERVPRHTTLEEFFSRVASVELIDRLVGEVLTLCRESGEPVHELAVDSTGVACTPASRHYELRIERKPGRYVKLMLAVACGSLLAVSAHASMGPDNDYGDGAAVLWRASGRARPHSAYLDSGFDSERIHGLCRDGMHCASFIPPVPRTEDGSIKSRHRSKCTRLPGSYGRRWHVESFISGMKRTCGSAVRAITERAMLGEAMLKVLAYSMHR